MKKTIISIAAVVAIVAMGSCSCQKSTKHQVVPVKLAYEQYCDSIWEADPDYYMDVLVETDEYQDYIAERGKWW